METRVNNTSFGSITINGREFRHDVIIRLSGKIEKRRKKLSKQVSGTSHNMSPEEAAYIYEEGCGVVVIGTGQHGVLKLMQEAIDFFADHGCHVILERTPEAIQEFNRATGSKIGLFHVTC